MNDSYTKKIIHFGFFTKINCYDICYFQSRYCYLRGTHLKTSTSLFYVNDVILPVLSSLFDHLAAYEYGNELLGKKYLILIQFYKRYIIKLNSLYILSKIVNEIQVAAYKMLSSLYILGTDTSLTHDR